MNDTKAALYIVPIAAVIHFLNTKGIFKAFPLGGGYMQILLCAIVGMIVARQVHKEIFKKETE